MSAQLITDMLIAGAGLAALLLLMAGAFVAGIATGLRRVDRAQPPARPNAEIEIDGCWLPISPDSREERR